MTAHALTLTAWDESTSAATIDLDVSAGYYVRSLARDLGQRLGVAAHLSALRRTASSGWTTDDAHGLARLVEATQEELLGMVLPLSAALASWPVATVDGAQVETIRRGLPVLPALGTPPSDLEQARLRVLDDTGRLVGLGRAVGAGQVHVDIVLA